MRITLFEKDGLICYSTSKISRSISAMESRLVDLGWRLVGYFYGRDISSSRIKTMRQVLYGKSQ